MKKAMCLMLSLIIVFGIASSVSAVSVVVNSSYQSTYDEASIDQVIDGNPTEEGRCGEKAYWGYYEDTKTLVVNGEGEVKLGASLRQPEYSQYPFEKLIVGEGITKLGSNSFVRCQSLKEVSLPDSLQEINNYVFFECKSLESIEIPKNVELLGTGIFSRCDALTEIKVDEDNPVFDSRDNCNAIIMTEGNFLRLGCKNTVIPNSVTSIGAAAFSECTGLISIELHDGIIEIYDSVFSKCENLETVVMSDNLQKLGLSAFEGCTKLKNITLPKKLRTVDGFAFMGCTNLESIVLPDKVTMIQQSAFNGCTKLSDVDFSEQLEFIGPMAFNKCTSLKEVSLPSTIERILPHAFNECTALETITINNPGCEIGDFEQTFPKAATIKGYEDSTAEEYAEKYNRKFKSIGTFNYIIGDVDLDGLLSILDATEIQLYLSLQSNFTKPQLSVADVDNDTDVSILDATAIQLKLAGLIK